MPQSFDPGGWKYVRAQFLLPPDLRHLSRFYLVSNPTPVRDATTNCRRAFAENPHSFLDDMFAREEGLLWLSLESMQERLTGMLDDPDDGGVIDAFATLLPKASTFRCSWRWNPGWPSPAERATTSAASR
ncbi:hypothetical protein [Streptomyces sp. 130]|uniref:hypothetical protein n=1 Tax=Streptomyces sp. 130 TaxID=2591006 RepID=UPI0028C42189|nr:hypothetical protein [Streptomyces sp. 130]